VADSTAYVWDQLEELAAKLTPEQKQRIDQRVEQYILEIK
jgi:hypothetical protein